MKLEDIESLMYLVRINCTDTITNADGTLDFGGLASHEIIAFTGSAFIFDNGMKFTAEELEAENTILKQKIEEIQAGGVASSIYIKDWSE